MSHFAHTHQTRTIKKSNINCNYFLVLAIAVMLLKNAVFSPKVCKFCRGSSPCCHVKPDLKQKSVTLTANQSTDRQRRWLRGGRGEATVFCLFSLRLFQMSRVLCQRGRRQAVCSVWRSSTDWLPLSSNDRWQIKKAKKKDSKTEVNRKQCEWMNEPHMCQLHV